MTEQKQPENRPKSDRRYNWYLDFKKREEAANKDSKDKQTVDVPTDG